MAWIAPTVAAGILAILCAAAFQPNPPLPGFMSEGSVAGAAVASQIMMSAQAERMHAMLITSCQAITVLQMGTIQYIDAPSRC